LTHTFYLDFGATKLFGKGYFVFSKRAGLKGFAFQSCFAVWYWFGNRFGTGSKEPFQSFFGSGTGSEPVRNRSSPFLAMEPVRNRFGTGSEPVRNRFQSFFGYGTGSEPVRTGSEPVLPVREVASLACTQSSAVNTNRNEIKRAFPK